MPHTELMPPHPTLSGTAEQTRLGAGVCVGRTFSGIRWKVIRIVDGPIRSLDEAEELPSGQIGELIVRGPQVTREYVTRRESNALAKIADGAEFWHRMGDSGYLDDAGRFWFCGRVAHCVHTADGPMYPIRCEAIFNQHPDIRRSALVGVGPPGRQRPVIILEPHKGRMPRRRESPRGVARRDPSARRGQPADGRHFRLPAAPRLSRRYPPQRQNLPREAGRVGKRQMRL